MQILITNDDGVFSEGLDDLYLQLKSLGSVDVVAPDRERSAIGHGITVHKPLRVTKVKMRDSGEPAWAVSGTPADCVKLALEALLDSPPDVIVSGINWGANIGTDVLYSGTVSAAIEGTIAGIKSVAVSLDVRGVEPIFAEAAKFTRKLVKLYHEQEIPSDTLLNVNIPDVPWSDIGGVEVTRLGFRRYIDSVEQRKDPRGRAYFWLAGQIEDVPEYLSGTDANALKENRISVCPVHFDLTKHDIIAQIQRWKITK